VLGLTPAHPAEHLFHEAGPAAAEYAARLGPASPLVQYQVIFHRRPERPLGSPPVLVLGAGEDQLIPARSVARAARFYGTEALVLPGMGHDVMLDRGWERALAALLDWAEALPGADG
jgi:pimeloyl-ACP methyl ester carboxylesterase